MKVNKYNLSLVPTPSAVGFAATDDALNILKPVHHKHAVGVRKFGEANVAVDRRLFRAARRNVKRTKARVHMLNEVMAPEIDKIDPEFFSRIKQSDLSPLDSRKEYKTILFDRPNMEGYYLRKFPTPRHLQKYLIETDKPADIRLVYWSLHSLLTHRGHFFNTTPVSQFKPGKLDIKNAFIELNNLNEIEDLSYAIENSPEIAKIIKTPMKNADKKNKLKELIYEVVTDGKIAKRNNKIATQFVSAILGNVFHLDVIFDMKINKEDKNDWKLQLNDESIDEKFNNISGGLPSEKIRTFEILQELFSSIALMDVLKGNDSLIEAKIEEYDKHKRDLRFFKKWLKELPEKDAKHLLNAYTLYIGNQKFDLLELRKEFKISAAQNFSREDFYKVVKTYITKQEKAKVLINPEKAHKIEELIDEDSFLKKLRTNENAYIPYQLNALIFNKILKNQGRFYPFLLETNPAKPDRREAPYKLSQVMQFHIPYYVGPLITPEEQAREGVPKSSKFAWLVRKEDGNITPWNFYDKVDLFATANAFIKRAIAKDTYLLAYPVMPKNSLLYQKYMVLDELSNIKVDDHKLNATLKQIIFNECFKKHTTVTTKMVINALKDHNVQAKEISGLSTPDKFNSSLSTYIRWSKEFGNKIDDPKYRDVIETMIEWSTVFEDRKILEVKLREIEWLTNKQIKFVVNQRLTGWGRFSRMLLEGIVDQNGRSIISTMYHTRKNFMQVINQGAYKVQIDSIRQKIVNKQTLDDVLSEAYLSPANKKAVRQTMKVVNEFVQMYHGAHPDKIFLLFQRSAEEEGKLTEARTVSLRKLFNGSKSPLITKTLQDELKEKTKKHVLNRKEYLYFQQCGRDGLTGEPINLNELGKYSVLHIIPRSMVADESINNSILTKIRTNNDTVAVKYGNQMIADLGYSVKTYWNDLKKVGLFSNAKLNNLLTDINSIDKYQTQGFVARQLVETNQIIKLVATILQSKFPETKIIEVRNDQLMNLRYKFDWYRIKEINDYYRGFDAYLAAVVGTYLYKVYPKARRFFVYGEYLKIQKNQKKDEDDKKPMLADKPNKHGFNYLWKLLYGKDDDIYVNHTSELAFNRTELIDKINKVYNYKFQSISIATEKRYAAMFKTTKFPRHDRDTAKTRKLIEKKKGYDTDIYGGYTASQSSYMVLIDFEKPNGTHEYGFHQMPTRYISILEQAKSPEDYQYKFNELMKLQLESEGRKYKNFKVLKQIIPYNQIILDDGGKGIITNYQTIWNARELILSAESQKAIMDYITDPNYLTHKPIKENKSVDERLNATYNEIVYQIKNYMPVFKANQNIKKFDKSTKLFDKLNFGEKVNVIRNILVVLQPNGASRALKEVGINIITNSHKYTPVSENAVLVYTSVTGLKESRVPIKKLLKNNNQAC